MQKWVNLEMMGFMPVPFLRGVTLMQETEIRELIEKWHEQSPEVVVEDSVVKLIRDVNSQCDHVIERR